MGLYLKLALRNVFRNRRRTLITVAAMGFGAAAIIVFGGFVNAIYWGVRESTIRSQLPSSPDDRRMCSAASICQTGCTAVARSGSPARTIRL